MLMREWRELHTQLQGALEVAFDRAIIAGWLPTDLEIVHDSTRGICMQLAIAANRQMMMVAPGTASAPIPLSLGQRLVMFDVIATFDIERPAGAVCWIAEHWVREMPLPARVGA